MNHNEVIKDLIRKIEERDAIINELRREIEQLRSENEELRKEVRQRWQAHLRNSLAAALHENDTRRRSELTGRCIPLQ